MTEHRRFVIQMAGWMGTGKSTLALAVGASSGAVVIDHDTTKSAILAAGAGDSLAGAASYESLFALTDDLLGQGHAVIIDSPSLYASIPERGMRIAAAHDVPYLFVECHCPDDLATRRLAQRSSRPSQVRTAEEAHEIRNDPARSSHRPSDRLVVVDTTTSLKTCVAEVVRELESPT